MEFNEVVKQTVRYVSEELEKAQAELFEEGKPISQTADVILDVDMPASSGEMARNLGLIPSGSGPEVSRVQVKVTIAVKTPKESPKPRAMVIG